MSKKKICTLPCETFTNYHAKVDMIKKSLILSQAHYNLFFTKIVQFQLSGKVEHTNEEIS